MIHYIEGFAAQVKRFGFGELHGLRQLHIKVFDSWPMEEASRSVSKLAQNLRVQNAGIKYRLAIAGIGVDIERTRKEFGRIQQIVIDAVTQGSEQRTVGIVIERHRKSTGEARDAGETPAFRQPVLAQESVKRQRVRI